MSDKIEPQIFRRVQKLSDGSVYIESEYRGETTKEIIRQDPPDWRERVEEALLRASVEPDAPAAQHRQPDRPRVLSDFPTPYREALAKLMRDGTRCSWPNVTTQLNLTTGLSLAVSTIQRWVGEDKLPTPAAFERENRAR